MSFQQVSKGKLLYRDSHYSIINNKGKLFISALFNNHVVSTTILPLPLELFQNICVKFRILVRILRLEPRMVIKSNEGIFLISFLGYLYSLSIQNDSWLLQKEHKYRLGMNNPLALVVIDSLPGFEDGVVYGEYWDNPGKENVCIMRKTKNKSWHIAYSFPANSITHIHGIIPDYGRNCIYILTGDEDLESGIWVSRNNFETVEPLLLGSQLYRSCIAFPTKQGLLFATDTPLEDNAIFLLYLDNERKNSVKKLYNLEGSCIYGVAVVREGLKEFIFSTTVEGDSRKKGFRYLLSRKRGQGIKSNLIKCYAIPESDLDSCRCIAKFKKDNFPFICQFGTVTFPNGDGSIACGSPIAVKKYDGTNLIFNLQGNQSE